MKVAARMQPDTEPTTHAAVVKHSLRSLARRHQQLSEEIRDLNKYLTRLVTELALCLIAFKGPLAADDARRRCSSPATSPPVPAASGKTNRHRLIRAERRAYVSKRRAGGKTTKELIRCLKRHIVRELHRLLVPRHVEPATPNTVRRSAA